MEEANHPDIAIKSDTSLTELSAFEELSSNILL